MRLSGLNAALAYFLSILTVSGAGAATESRQLLEPNVYFSVGGELYRFDYSDFLDHRQAFVEGNTPCWTLTAYSTVPQDTATAASFAFSGQPTIDEMVWLGEAPLAGVDSLDWHPLLLHQRCRDEDGVTITTTVREDTVSWTFPWSVFREDVSALHANDVVTLTVNGTSLEIAPSLAFQAAVLAASRYPLRLDHPEELDELAERFRSLPSFANALQGLIWQFAVVDQNYSFPVSGPVLMDNCGWDCTMCGISLGGTVVGAIGGIIAGCNPATAALSAGGTCVLAATGIVVATAETVDQCRECDLCRQRRKKPGGGGGSTGPIDCPPRYFQCCNGMCCSEIDPPDTCPQE